MKFPWDEGLVKQVKDIFVCDVLECKPVELEEEQNNGEKCSMGK